MSKYNNILTIGIKVLSYRTVSPVEYNTGTYKRGYELTYAATYIYNNNNNTMLGEHL